jgi:predicted adenylyl cyclase CyaB
MARNVEVKAWLGARGAIAALEPAVAAIATEGPTPLAQDDTFFECPGGRLKLRVFADGRGELIFYRRDDATGPKTSTYRRCVVADPDALRDALGEALGVLGRVRKRRTLYLVGRTRVHLDAVEGLDDHLELEVVLRDDEPAARGEAEARDLLERLGLHDDRLVAGAYLDLLQSRAARAGHAEQVDD